MTSNDRLRKDHEKHLTLIGFLKGKMHILRKEIRLSKAPYGTATPTELELQVFKDTAYEYYLIQAMDSIISRIRTHRRSLRHKEKDPTIYERYVEPSRALVLARSRNNFQGRGYATKAVFRSPKLPVGWVGNEFNVRPAFFKLADTFSVVVDGVTILDVDEVVKMDDYIVAKIIGFTQHRASGTWIAKPAVGYVAKHVGFGIEAYGESGDARALRTCEQRVLKHIDNKIKGV